MAMVEHSMAARAAIAEIASRILNRDTLDCGRHDHRDCHELPVCRMSTAFQAAYLADVVDHHRRG